MKMSHIKIREVATQVIFEFEDSTKCVDEKIINMVSYYLEKPYQTFVMDFSSVTEPLTSNILSLIIAMVKKLHDSKKKMILRNIKPDDVEVVKTAGLNFYASMERVEIVL